MSPSPSEQPMVLHIEDDRGTARLIKAMMGYNHISTLQGTSPADLERLIPDTDHIRVAILDGRVIHGTAIDLLEILAAHDRLATRFEIWKNRAIPPGKIMAVLYSAGVNGETTSRLWDQFEHGYLFAGSTKSDSPLDFAEALSPVIKTGEIPVGFPFLKRTSEQFWRREVTSVWGSPLLD